MWFVVVVNVWCGMVFLMVVMYVVFKVIDLVLYEVVDVDGVNFW